MCGQTNIATMLLAANAGPKSAAEQTELSVQRVQCREEERRCQKRPKGHEEVTYRTLIDENWNFDLSH